MNKTLKVPGFCSIPVYKLMEDAVGFIYHLSEAQMVCIMQTTFINLWNVCV